MSMDPVTLDQLHVFVTVVEQGSFSAAARHLRRAQSAVSYAIANLERLLDVPLFDRRSKTPELTDAGRALLSDAHAILYRTAELQARARAMHQGVEPRLTLAVDVLFPMATLVEAVEAFQREFAAVELLLRSEALGGVAQLVRDGVCQVGLSAELPRFPEGLHRWPMGSIEMVTVVAREHELARHRGFIPAQVMREHVHLVLSDRSDLTAGVDFGVLGGRVWRLMDLRTRHALLRAGLGWARMPKPLVAEDLRRGRLVRIRPADYGPSPFHLNLFAVYRTADPPGPAARWLLGRLGACPDDMETPARRPPRPRPAARPPRRPRGPARRPGSW